MSGISNPALLIDEQGGNFGFRIPTDENTQHTGNEETAYETPQLTQRRISPVVEGDTPRCNVDMELPQMTIEETTLKDSSKKKQKGDVVSRAIDAFWKAVGRTVKKNKSIISKFFLVALNVAVFVYLAFAIVYWKDNGDCDYKWCDGFGMLIILMSIIYFFLFYFLVIKRFFGKTIYHYALGPVERFWDRIWKSCVVVRGVVYLVPLITLAAFLIIDTADNRARLISFLGTIVIMLLGFIFSKHPGQVRWRPVFWGLSLQFIFGLLTIRWSVGRQIFQCVGDKVALFLSYSYNGSAFVYGDQLVYEYKTFAFQVLPVIFFFSFMLHILFYWGAIQWLVLKLGWLLQISMGTTVCESVNAAASVFLGMSESPLLIKPFIKDLTRSEIHAIMAEGFATVAGTVLAAYISFGVSPAHLVTASVMSAPASLCYAKLFYPETEESKTKVNNIVMESTEDASVLDAATKGALAGIDLVMGIISNIVAFVAFIAFLNAVTAWFGELVGLTHFDFQTILSKVFIPLSWLMGVEPSQCEDVGMLIGLKTVVNEFVAYKELGVLKRAGKLSPRSEAIATYALCGFANPSSIGILIGALSTLCPEQRPNITEVAFRAFIAGSATCFLTACIAGILLTEDSYGEMNGPSNTSALVPFSFL